MTLARLKQGSRGVIKQFLINCEDKASCRFAHRLKEMGLHEDARFEILQNSGTGEVIASCEGSRIVLGRGMADKICVEVTDGEVAEDTVFTKFCKRFGIRCRP
jgi:ferrous iron transport protein A